MDAAGGAAITGARAETLAGTAGALAFPAGAVVFGFIVVAVTVALAGEAPAAVPFGGEGAIAGGEAAALALPVVGAETTETPVASTGPLELAVRERGECQSCTIYDDS